MRCDARGGAFLAVAETAFECFSLWIAHVGALRNGLLRFATGPPDDRVKEVAGGGLFVSSASHAP